MWWRGVCTDARGRTRGEVKCLRLWGSTVQATSLHTRREFRTVSTRNGGTEKVPTVFFWPSVVGGKSWEAHLKPLEQFGHVLAHSTRRALQTLELSQRRAGHTGAFHINALMLMTKLLFFFSSQCHLTVHRYLGRS